MCVCVLVCSDTVDDRIWDMVRATSTIQTTKSPWSKPIFRMNCNINTFLNKEKKNHCCSCATFLISAMRWLMVSIAAVQISSSLCWLMTDVLKGIILLAEDAMLASFVRYRVWLLRAN